MENLKIKLFEKCQQYRKEWEKENDLMGADSKSTLVKGGKYTAFYEFITECGLEWEFADWTNAQKGAKESV